LSEAGVHPVLAADPAAPTGRLVTLVAPDGERSFLTDRAANTNLCRDDLPDALLDGVDLVHVSGYALFAPRPRAAVLGLLDEARRRGIPFTLDPSSWSFLESAGAQNFLGWTRAARIAFPNEREAAVLAGTNDTDRQLKVLTRTYELVVLKRGTEAAHAADSAGRRWSVPVPKVEAVDSSGGGDAFLGGFLAAWLRGEDIEDCLHRGVTLGADAVTRFGGRPPGASSNA
jgi:sugar/nucleoside kinase (ribokinase family)